MLFQELWQKVIFSLITELGPASKGLNLTEIFGPHLSPGAAILVPSDADYAVKASQRWTATAAPSFAGTIQPATVQDIQNVVKISAAYDLPFLVTGGGHGLSETLAGVRNGVQVDLKNFDGVVLDKDTGRLTVGSGVKFSQVQDVVYGSDYQFPIGTAPCVGVLGATLGGGVSSAQGRLGLLSDLLESARVVTSSGGLVTASRDENPDLFWGLRGAGVNLGVVANATFALPRAINAGVVTNSNFLFKVTAAQAVFEVLASFDSMLPAELALNVATFAPWTTGEVMIVVNANYFGPAHEAEKLLEPFVSLSPLRYEFLGVPWPRVFETSYFGMDDVKACARNQKALMYSISAVRTDAPLMARFVDELVDFVRANPEIPLFTFVIHRFPTQAVMAVDDGDSAYAHRSLKMHIQLESLYADEDQKRAADDFFRAARMRFLRTSGYNSSTVYTNFAHGDEGPAAWYGARKLDRLSNLKLKWDPNELLSFYNQVPLPHKHEPERISVSEPGVELELL